jgi:hypothetical protein
MTKAGDAEALRTLLRSPSSHGAGAIHVLGREPFWDEEALPFSIHGGGNVLRVVPQRGFRRDNLAGTRDERLLIVDCPDAEGWLAPSGIVAAWLSRHVRCAPLDDLLLAHPLYSHLTKVDAKGHSLMGLGRLTYWTPGMPAAATLAEPPFLPGDRNAPLVNRQRKAYADAVVSLMGQLKERFDLLEVEVGARLS